MPEKTFHSLTLPGQPTARVPLTAVEFNTGTAYAIRDYCTYQGKLYRCIAAHAAGAWNAAHFTETNIDNELDGKLMVPPYQASAPSNPRVGDLWVDSDENSPVYNVDSQPIAGSTNAVQSGGTFNAIKSVDDRKGNRSLLSGDYSASATYEVNQLVMNGQQMYRCTTRIATPEAWNAAHWTATNLNTELDRLRTSEADTDMIAENYGDSSSYAVGDYVVHNSDLFRCISEVSDTGSWDPDDWNQVKIADEVSDLKSATDAVIDGYPEEAYQETEVPYSVNWFQGGIDTGGNIGTQSTRIRSDYIPVGAGVIGSFSSTPNTAYWVRVFDENKVFIGSGTASSNGTIIKDPNSSSNPINVDTVLSLYPTAKYIALSMMNASASGDILPSQNGMTFVASQEIFVGINLKDYFAEKDEVQEIKDSLDSVTEVIEAISVPIDVETMQKTAWYVSATGNVNNSGTSITLSLSIPIATAGVYHIQKASSPKFRIGYSLVSPYAGILLDGFENLGTATEVTITLPGNCYLVICYFVNDSSEIDKEALTNSIKVFLGEDELSAVDKVVRSFFSKKPYVAAEQVFSYPVGNGYETTGFLKLPPNYNPDGEEVPLIVFVHGSGDVSRITIRTMTSSYQDYYNYLRDCGYAIFDCYAYSNKFPQSESSSANTWGLPINDACYLAGIDYVCKNWNVSKENVFVACKSLGGLEAMSALFKPSFTVKAVGMLAPELNWLAMTFGYLARERIFNASELGFSEDVNDVLNWSQGESKPSGFYDYVTANIDKWVGAFTNYTGLPILDSDKPNYYLGLTGTGNMIRNGANKPVKIWIAEDDSAVSYANAVALINSLRNGGNKAELRTMPSGTGGHHAVDNDPNALQTTNVTTKLGITYATIPTAYYELGQFFDQYLTV